jgi:hypothetical protein
MPASKTTMPEALTIAKLYEQGYGTKRIAAATAKSRKAVRTALRHLGVQMRDLKEARRAELALKGDTHGQLVADVRHSADTAAGNDGGAQAGACRGSVARHAS